MGFKTLGFAGGREDVWEPKRTSTGARRTPGSATRDTAATGSSRKPLAAVQMGLIYVNPEGPNGVPDPLAAARDIRETFRRMAMNDEETVALIAGGHTFGKSHGAVDQQYIGPEPEAAGMEEQGLGWKNSRGNGGGADTFTGGPEGTWTTRPVEWDNNFFENLFGYEWELTASPAGAKQWTPKDASAVGTVPDAHDPVKRHAPMMLTTDLSLRMDPVYEKISRRFYANPDEFSDAFARAWYKLTHRDLGPCDRGLGPWVPAEPQLWQDPVPEVVHELIDAENMATLKAAILGSGLTVSELVLTAWARRPRSAAPTGAAERTVPAIRLAPQRDWAVNNPAELAKVLGTLEGIMSQFNSSQTGGKRVSFADVIVLGGCTAVEQAVRSAGHDVQVPFAPGRTDATQGQTDVESFAVLEPRADGFRNYLAEGHLRSAEALLLDRAQMLALSAPEMTVLVGGMRVLNANFDHSGLGVLTTRPGTLTNDFFVNLLDMGTTWEATSVSEETFEGRGRVTGGPSDR